MSIDVKKAGVLMGGTSAERDVSLKSGSAVSRALAELGINHVNIDADGTVCSKLMAEGIDFAFITLHGGWGENGAVQGLLEILGIPYTGSGVLASSMAMDKVVSKKVFLHHGISVTPYFVLDRNEEIRDDEYISHGLELPLFVKPATEGSSVGGSIVRERSRFQVAVEQAFTYGNSILVEKYIKGKEIQIGILGDKALGGVEVRPSEEFYSYEAKYTSGSTKYILPPELDLDTYERAMSAALDAHRALGCTGATRVDLIIDGADLYVLEVNTIPGMTETSLLPKIAELAGYDFKGLIREMIEDALKKRI